MNEALLIRERLVAALPSRHRLASTTRIPLSALASEPFILPPRDIVPVFHDAILRACRKAGFLPHAPHEADHLQMVLGMIAAGAGVGLVPAAAHRITQHRIAYRPLHPPAEEIATAVIWRRDETSPLVAEFVRAALASARKSA